MITWTGPDERAKGLYGARIGHWGLLFTRSWNVMLVTPGLSMFVVGLPLEWPNRKGNRFAIGPFAIRLHL